MQSSGTRAAKLDTLRCHVLQKPSCHLLSLDAGLRYQPGKGLFARDLSWYQTVFENTIRACFCKLAERADSTRRHLRQDILNFVQGCCAMCSNQIQEGDGFRLKPTLDHSLKQISSSFIPAAVIRVLACYYGLAVVPVRSLDGSVHHHIQNGCSSYNVADVGCGSKSCVRSTFG